MKLTKRVLYNRARPMDFRYPVKNLQLVREMLKFMRDNQGIGLAAPQIGISRRVFVMGIDGKDWAFFNPKIIDHSDDLTEFNEGCLSFKGDQCIITRPSEIQVNYQDHTGQEHQERFCGLPARCFQHELDHLDGITMWDRHKEQNAKQP